MATTRQRAPAIPDGRCPRCKGRGWSETIDGDPQCISCGHVVYQQLTPSEVAMMRGLADGMTRTEIATQLCYSLPVVDRALKALYCRLGVRNGCQAVAYCIRRGLI